MRLMHHLERQLRPEQVELVRKQALRVLKQMQMQELKAAVIMLVQTLALISQFQAQEATTVDVYSDCY